MSPVYRRQKLYDTMEARTRASVAEMLYEIARALAKLKGSEHLSGQQLKHVDAAREHIEAAVGEWIDDVLGSARPRASAHEKAAEPSRPKCPERGLESVLDMLAIYHDDIDERDFTEMQLQRLMIAGHNLLVVEQEFRKHVH